MRFLIIGTTLLFLVGCGGENGGTPSQQQNATGLWEGQYRGKRAISQITSKGVSYIYVEQYGAFYGLAAVDAANISINGTMFYTFPVDASLSGTVNTGAEIRGSFGDSYGGIADIVLGYSSASNRGSSLSKLEGTWNGNETFYNLSGGGAVAWTMTFSSDGHFAATRDGACNITGDFSVIDITRNEYNVIADVDCGGSYKMNGNYVGIAATSDGAYQDNMMTMAIANDQNIFVIQVSKYSTNASLVNTWKLISENGVTPGWTEILVLNANDSFSDTATLNNGSSCTLTGTYTVNGNVITSTATATTSNILCPIVNATASYTYLISGNSLTFTNTSNNNISVYQKQ